MAHKEKGQKSALIDRIDIAMLATIIVCLIISWL